MNKYKYLKININKLYIYKIIINTNSDNIFNVTKLKFINKNNWNYYFY